MNSYTVPITWTTTNNNSNDVTDGYTWIDYDSYTSYRNWSIRHYSYTPVIKYPIDNTIFKTLKIL